MLPVLTWKLIRICRMDEWMRLMKRKNGMDINVRRSPQPFTITTTMNCVSSDMLENIFVCVIPPNYELCKHYEWFFEVFRGKTLVAQGERRTSNPEVQIPPQVEVFGLRPFTRKTSRNT